MDIEFAYYNLTLRELQEDMGERGFGGGEEGGERAAASPGSMRAGSAQ